MVGARCDQEHGSGERAQQGDHEGVALQFGGLLEPLRERNREQEGEQHLNTWQRDAQLVQQLDQLAVDPLLMRLLRHRRGEYGYAAAAASYDSS